TALSRQLHPECHNVTRIKRAASGKNVARGPGVRAAINRAWRGPVTSCTTCVIHIGLYESIRRIIHTRYCLRNGGTTYDRESLKGAWQRVADVNVIRLSVGRLRRSPLIVTVFLGAGAKASVNAQRALVCAQVCRHGTSVVRARSVQYRPRVFR